ncbi:MAG: class I SAM-dependent methyltransferase [Candidatus Omnitrophota bacterium]
MNDKHALFRMKAMKNNNQWVFKLMLPYLGKNILEVGSGIGNLTELLIPLGRRLILTDVDTEYVDYLRKRFAGNPGVRIIPHDIQRPFPAGSLSSDIDTVVCVNVLEHIKDDHRALENISNLLQNGGTLFLMVPALELLYGSLDKMLGHFRRYEKNDLLDKLRSRGFTVDKIYFHNFFSAFGWLLNSRILKRRFISHFQISALDCVIPVLAALEGTAKLPLGISLVAVCRKY